MNPSSRTERAATDADVFRNAGDNARPHGGAAAKMSARGITKCFGGFLANDAISLDIMDGEFLTLLGGSGSGKTTLMRVIAGLETADSGRILIDGQDVTTLPPRRRNLGMVFQQYSLFPHMSIAENIGYGLSVQRKSRHEIAQRVGEMLDLIHLPDVGDRLPSQLSGGQQQRVALARALATRPSLLMLDEPLGALDLKLRRQLQVELKRIHRETGTTFLFVTHDQEEALYLSDRIAVMRNGRIEQLATPHEIYQAPVNEFVADFIGDVTMMPCRSLGPGRVEIAGVGAIDLPGPNPAGEFTLAVRPEYAGLHETAVDNALEGRLVEIVHEGSTTLYVVALPAGINLKARRLGAPDPALELSQRVFVTIEGPKTILQAAH